MDLNQTKIFKKSFLSPNGKLTFTFTFIFLAIGFSNWINYSSEGTIHFLLASIVAYNYFSVARTVTLTEEGFFINTDFFDWNNVRFVNFKVGIRDFTHQNIEIHLKDSATKIVKPRFYKENKLLRKSFEELVVKKGISTEVEDRGI